MGISLRKLFIQGGAGSGHRGHRGRVGLVGGSVPGKGSGVKQETSKPRGAKKSGKVDMSPLKEIPTVEQATEHGVFGRASFIYDGKVYDSGEHHDQVIDKLGFKEGYPGVSEFLKEGGIRIRSVDGKFLYIQGEFSTSTKRSFVSDIQEYADEGLLGDIYSYKTIVIENNFLDPSLGRIEELKVETTGKDFMEDEFRFVKMNSREERQQLFTQGGIGSGHRGHRGRPGLVGGSSREGVFNAPKPGETEEEWQARLARRRARRKARKEREKGGSGTETPPPEPTVKKERRSTMLERHRQRAEEIAERLGFPAERLNVTVKPGHNFVLEGRTFRSAGQYDPRSGEVSIYNVQERTQSQLEGILAHEVQHWHYDNFKKETHTQFLEVNRIVRDKKQENWPITEIGGTVKPELQERYWAYHLDRNYLNPSRRYESDSMFNVLREKDGVSSYSTDYWKQAEKSDSPWDYNLAINETLAEIARIEIKSHRSGDVPTVDPVWMDVYNTMKKHRRTSQNSSRKLFLFGGKGEERLWTM